MSLNKLLISLKILDADDQTLNLSAVLVVILAARLALFPIDAFTLIALAIVIANYNAKKGFAFIRNRKNDETLQAINVVNQKAETALLRLQQLENQGSLGNILNQYRG